MNLKKSILIFSLLLFSFSFSQDNIAQLPYNKMPKYPKKVTTGIVIAKMIDEFGYKYYWATDSLLNDELRNSFNSSNLPRLLLKSVYQMSENIINYTSGNKMNPELKLEEMSFEDFRKNTLLNLKDASDKLIKNAKSSIFLNWNFFIKYIAFSDAYCDQIILFRENFGNPFKLKNDFIEQKPSKSKMFDQSIGADGLTNWQWKKIMERGGGRDAADIIRGVGKENQKVNIKLRKEERRATVKAGNLESLDKFSNIVDGLSYTYFNVPPKQLSFLFSSDKELMEGIINWIIYINAGNPVNLLEMFRVGLDIIINLDTNEDQSLLVGDGYRDIVDKKENKIRLEFSEKYFDKTKFSDIIINEVHINNNDQIEFFEKSNRIDNLYQKPQQKIIILKNIEGNLLNRIKVNVNQMREGFNEYNDSIMNLRKY